jgi:hypothetical protein
VQQLTEVDGWREGEPVAELLRIAAVEAAVLVAAEVGGQVEAVGAFSSLKAIIRGSYFFTG